MWSGLPCIYMRILWKEVFNPIHFKTLFVYPYRDISSIIKVGCRTIWGCSGLASIYVYAEKVPKMDSDAFKGCDAKKCILYVPKGTYMVRLFDVE